MPIWHTKGKLQMASQIAWTILRVAGCMCVFSVFSVFYKSVWSTKLFGVSLDSSIGGSVGTDDLPYEVYFQPPLVSSVWNWFWIGNRRWSSDGWPQFVALFRKFGLPSLKTMDCSRFSTWDSWKSLRFLVVAWCQSDFPNSGISLCFVLSFSL